jgi:hypothetical protein
MPSLAAGLSAAPLPPPLPPLSGSVGRGGLPPLGDLRPPMLHSGVAGTGAGVVAHPGLAGRPGNVHATDGVGSAEMDVEVAQALVLLQEAVRGTL